MALQNHERGFMGCLVVVGKLNPVEKPDEVLNIALFGKRCGEKGSECSVKVEEKPRGQIPENGNLAQLL